MTYERESTVDRRPRWLLLANAARARLLERDPDNGALRELNDFVHPGARLKASDRGHDRPGQGARGDAHTSFAPPTDPVEREHRHFVHELAQALDAAAREQRLPPWALMASSPFLGRLRAGLSDGVTARLVHHDDRDLTGLPLHELEPLLRRLLPPSQPAG